MLFDVTENYTSQIDIGKIHKLIALIYTPSFQVRLFVYLLFLSVSSLNLKINRLRALKSISLVQLLPSTDTARLNANHILPPILWLKVAHTGRLVDPRVPDNHVVQVVADQAEALSAAFCDYDWVLGALGWCIYTVRLAREVDHTSLRLCLGAVNLVDVGSVFETGDFDGGDVLVFVC
jgi:hypothetical protein